ncbi:Fe2+-dependent dioxygenase [Leisingera sp. D0M16]|uniref:Fe2+-dependent dioxygenase n=1 Tax=Leisingera coralii TaxID=3351347 RepID=UPI003B7F0692
MLEIIPEVVCDATRREMVKTITSMTFVDGKKTAGKRAARVKKNEQIGDSDLSAKKDLQAMVVKALKSNSRFQRFALPAKIATPLISRYRSGMEYGLHVDNATMAEGSIRTDLSVTVFLNDAEEYEGGELEIFSGFGPVKVKLAAGSAVVYPSSTLHRVLPVTRGERLAAVTWVESQIRDPARREILYDMGWARNRLEKDMPEAEETDRANRAYTNLLRMWTGT